MSKYAAPLAEIRFVMFDLLKVEDHYARLPGGEAATRDILDAILDEAAKFAAQMLAPINATGDEKGCQFDKATASVTTPKGFKAAYAAFAEFGHGDYCRGHSTEPGDPSGGRFERKVFDA